MTIGTLEQNFGVDPNDRRLIDAALEDHDPDHPVALELAIRIDALRGVLAHVMVKHTSWPQEITVARPATVLDEVAIDLFCNALLAEGLPISVRVL